MKYEVAEHFIENFTKQGDSVLDCFMGTGTTGVACLRLNRLFTGIEISDKYFNDGKKRLELVESQLTLF